MALPLTGELPAPLHRTPAARRFVLGTCVTAVIASIGLGGFIYYRNNSPHQLAIKAQLAIEQHDPNRAIDYMNRALAKNPTGDALTYDRKLMAKALIDAGREADARSYLQQVLAEKPDNADALDMLAESHVHPPFRKFQQAFKPISAAAAPEIYASIKEELAALQQLPQTPRNLAGEAELDHLDYLIVTDQAHQASATLEAAQIAQDGPAIAQAQQQLGALGEAQSHLQEAMALLKSALQQDPKNANAARLLAQYDYENHDYAAAMTVYQQMKSEKEVPQELAITAANALLVDAARQPDRMKRFADAQQILETYLTDHPKDSRILVAIGQVLLEQDKIAEAVKMADRATTEVPGDLDAQILLINCRLREKKTADALALITPLTNNNSGVPQVWYLLGQANSDAANYPAAEDAFRKALSLNPGFLPARRALLTNEIRSGNTEAATTLAAQLLHDDRYYMPAWAVTIDSLRKAGQSDRARGLLTSLAEDPSLPAESTPDLIRLLAENNAPAAANALLRTLPANDPQTLRLKASVAAAAADTPNALAFMVQALSADAADTGLRLQYADLLTESHRAADARAQLDQVTHSTTPLTGDESLHAARAYLALRLPAQSAAITQQLLAAQPQNVEARTLNQQAETMLAGGVAGNATLPPPTDAHTDDATIDDTLHLATAALAKKDYSTALSLARGALVQDTSNARLHEIAARALAGLGQLDQAVDEVAAAAGAQPDSPAAFAVFVSLFPDADSAAKGLAFASRLVSVNPALGDWAMGRLAETSGQSDLALRYYSDGLASTNRVTDPAAAKESLYSAVLALEASRKDAAALKKSAEQFAADRPFALSVRLAAAGDLLTLGDRAGAEQQLTTLTNALSPTGAPPRITLAVAQYWLSLDQPDRARALIEKQIAAGNKDPQLLSADASLLQQSDPARALALIQQLVQQDPQNPQYQIALSQIQAATGDEAAAFRTLDDARALGPTGQQLAATARLRLLISLGLLKEAADELAAHPAPTSDDFASMLAIGQAWSEMKKPDEARKILDAIPDYAAEHIPAVVTLATLDLEAGHPDAAVAALQTLKPQSPNDANQIAGALYHADIRAGNPAAALEIAEQQRDHATPGTAKWQAATLFAAAAAREGRNYDQAAALLQSLDPEIQKQSALDLALLQFLQHQDAAAAQTAAAMADTAPAYARTTLRLLATPHGSVDTAVFSNGTASAVEAALAALSPDQQRAALPALAKNPHVFAADIESLLNELAADPATAAARLHTLALSQTLLEAGWTTTTLDLLDALDKSGQPLTLALVQRHEALTDLHRDAEADKIRDTLAAALQQNSNAAPSVRVLLAAALAQKNDFTGALATLQPLAALNRSDILTTLATFHEKLGQLDQAVALHRQVRALDPTNLLAANNLAYTLAALHPTDPAALAEAKAAIEFAIQRAPNVQAFQDTLGWIKILSGQAADGTQRIARALPSFRLDPAVHYHLGIGYAKIGQPALARLHLQDVEAMAETQPIPELPLALAALKSLPATTPN
jgi:tetratricopeptide (TPR) repeat protein